MVAEQVEIQAKYHGYIERQKDEVARNADYEDIRLPLDLDYTTVRGLSSEVQQKLNQFKPETAGQAATDFRHNASGNFVIAGTCETWFFQPEKKEKRMRSRDATR